MFNEFIEDTRGQPIGIGRFFLALLVGGILFMVVLTPVATPLLQESMNATDHEKTNEATGWFQEWIEYTPIIMLMISVFGVLLVAVFQRNRVS